MVNNIKNNTISEIDAKKRLNTLNIIKNSEIKHRRIISGQKELLNLFDDLSNIILTDKTLKSESQEDKNEENENENDYENEDEDDYYDYENQNKTIDQNKIIKGLNDILDEIIGKSKSFEEQIKSSKKLEGLKGYWPYKNYDDKELKSKHFKMQLADMSNKIDKKLFEQIFDHTLIKLTDKEENQIIVSSIKKNKDKLFETNEFGDWVIKPNSQRINLNYAIDLILDFKENKYESKDEDDYYENENKYENKDENLKKQK